MVLLTMPISKALMPTTLVGQICFVYTFYFLYYFYFVYFQIYTSYLDWRVSKHSY